MRVVLGQQRPSVSVASHRDWGPMRGTERTHGTLAGNMLNVLAPSGRIRGDCTTCMEMFGNGVATGMGLTPADQ